MPFTQVYIPKRRTLIQVLPPFIFFCYLLMHIYIYAFCLRIAIRQPMRTPSCTHTGLIRPVQSTAYKVSLIDRSMVKVHWPPWISLLANFMGTSYICIYAWVANKRTGEYAWTGGKEFGVRIGWRKYQVWVYAFWLCKPVFRLLCITFCQSVWMCKDVT